MNISTVKALVPAENFIPVPFVTKLEAVSCDLYPRQYREQTVYTIGVPEESDGNYGSDGRRLINPGYAKFINIYA